MTMFQPTDPRGYSSSDLRAYWSYLNLWRKNALLQRYSYEFLAELARDANSIPGEAFNLSKATIYAVMHDTYSAATADCIRQRLAQCITSKLEDMRTCFPSSRPQSAPLPDGPCKSVSVCDGPCRSVPTRPKRKRRTQRIHRRRCSIQGYLTWQNNTYYLGSAFAGASCTLSSLRDRSRGIRVTTAGASRTAYPIDPSTSQLGYEVQN